jgi:hypothetical protein
MNPRLSRAAFVLLGLLTVATAGGPVAIALTLRGGNSPRWPPDRPVEWWTFASITGLVVALVVACLAIGLSRWRRALPSPEDRPRGEPLDDRGT